MVHTLFYRIVFINNFAQISSQTLRALFNRTDIYLFKTKLKINKKPVYQYKSISIINNTYLICTKFARISNTGPSKPRQITQKIIFKSLPKISRTLYTNIYLILNHGAVKSVVFPTKILTK